MARIEPISRTVYRAPTAGRTYLTARAAANREAAAMLARKYPTERDSDHNARVVTGAVSAVHQAGDIRRAADPLRFAARRTPCCGHMG